MRIALLGAAAAALAGCTVNGQSVGPRFGGGSSSATMATADPPAASSGGSASTPESSPSTTAPPTTATAAASPGCSDQKVPLAESGNVHYAQLPDLVGLSEKDARARLSALGFAEPDVDQTANCKDGAPAGSVCHMDAQPGCYLTNKSIELLVSDGGSELLEVPDLTGMTLQNATTALQHAGFTHDVDQDFMVTGPECTGKVCGQEPSARSRARRDSRLRVKIRN